MALASWAQEWLPSIIGKPFWEAPWWSHSVEAQAEVRKGIVAAAAGELFRSEAIHIAADGSVAIEITNTPAAGETYSPTRTTLRGRRVAPPRIAGEGIPPVAAHPAAANE